MYEVVVSEGLVLDRRAVGEANVLVSILTKKLGLVRARAQGARLQKSKLRYGLQLLTTGRYSFVRGKREWRLVGVDDISRDCVASSHTAVMGRVIKLLLRLVHGEEASGLYGVVAEGFSILTASEAAPQRRSAGAVGPTTRSEEGTSLQVSPDAVEVVMVLRILSTLGYLPKTAALEPFMSGEVTTEVAAKALQSRSLLIKMINESLHQTGL